MIMSALFSSNIRISVFARVLFIFSIPRKLIIKISTHSLSLSRARALSVCVIWSGVTWEYKASARALRVTHDSRVDLERRYFTKNTAISYLLKLYNQIWVTFTFCRRELICLIGLFKHLSEMTEITLASCCLLWIYRLEKRSTGGLTGKKGKKERLTCSVFEIFSSRPHFLLVNREVCLERVSSCWLRWRGWARSEGSFLSRHPNKESLVSDYQTTENQLSKQSIGGSVLLCEAEIWWCARDLLVRNGHIASGGGSQRTGVYYHRSIKH